MAGKCDPTDELITYLEMRLEADGLDYREAVMIEDLMASLSKLQGSQKQERIDPGPTDTERFRTGVDFPPLGRKSSESGLS